MPDDLDPSANGPSSGSPRRRRVAPWALVALLLGAVVTALVVTALVDRGARRETGLVPESGPRVRDGTAAMRERLARLVASVDPERSPYANRARVPLWRERLEAAVSPEERFDARVRLGLELLRAGESEAAADVLEEALESVEERPPSPERGADLWLLHQFLGIAWLRLAEQSNCLLHHSADSCILPIRGEGLHRDGRGSRGAMEHFRAALQINGQDIASVWLLNIAAMTLGEHPRGVPERWRIAPEVFTAGAPCERFRDVAGPAGVAELGLSGGAALDDFDGDGFLDILCSSWGLADSLRLFRNRGDGTFEDRTSAANLEGITGGLNLIHGDYDNDGDLDALILRGAWLGADGRHPNSLLRNDGSGRFQDVTEAAGLLSERPTQTAAFADYDGDGWLDLFIGNESDDTTRYPCELYHNEGDGTFSECAAISGLDITAFVKGVAWGDYDEDGDPDLYLSCLDEPNRLLRNDGPADGSPRSPADGRPRPAQRWRFTDVTELAGVEQPRRSFPTWFWDFDGDGRLDLFVASYEWEETTARIAADALGLRHGCETPRLYRNRGDGTFEDLTQAAGLDRALVVMGCGFGDIDEDGRLDAYLGTGEPSLSALMPNRLFRNVDGRRFEDVTAAGGFGHLQKGHGIAFGDIDHDGDQDIYAVLGGAYEGDVYRNALFENPGEGRHWLELELEGTRSNRRAVGARVDVWILEEPDGARRRIHRVVGADGSFGSSSLRQEIGLGEARRIERVEIRWPASGVTQRFDEVAPNAAYRIREGEDDLRPVERRRFRFGS